MVQRRIGDGHDLSSPWLAGDPRLEGAFDKAAAAANLSGLKGHRSVGGFRASIYNAMDVDSIDALTAVMRDFAKKNG